MNSSIKKLIDEIFSDTEAEEFSEWAFGIGYKCYEKPKDFMSAWNQRHFYEHRIFDNGKISEDLPEMVKIWKLKKSKGV